MDFWNILAVILSLTALFGYLNERWLHLAPSIGIMLLSLGLSLVLLVLQQFGLHFDVLAQNLLTRISFDDTVLHGLVGFLLFAGGLSIDVGRLKQNASIVAVLSVVGAIVSTIVVGLGTYFLLRMLGHPLPWIYSLLFGALISPTDPIAVLALLRGVGVSENLEMQIAGESLFNDGIGLTLFLLLLHLISNGTQAEILPTVWLFAHEALGGLLFGAILGGAAYCLMQGVRDHSVVILLFLAIASGGFALAQLIGVSGALSMVVAGLILGHDGRHYRAMTSAGRNRVDVFWQVVDEILNALLFMLIGLEFIAVFKPQNLMPILFVIPLVLLARLASISLPWYVLKHYLQFDRGTVQMMTWGGLRGGLAVALALSLPAGQPREVIVAMTYGVVIFSLLVQGTTIGHLLKHYRKESESCV